MQPNPSGLDLQAIQYPPADPEGRAAAEPPRGIYSAAQSNPAVIGSRLPMDAEAGDEEAERRALVIVPGFCEPPEGRAWGSRTRRARMGAQLDEVVKAIKAKKDGQVEGGVQVASLCDVNGSMCARLSNVPSIGPLRPFTVDAYEVYWHDLIDELDSQELPERIGRTVLLFFYWLSPSIYRPPLPVSLRISLFVAVASCLIWLYALLPSLLIFIANTSGVPEDEKTGAVDKKFFIEMAWAGRRMGSWIPRGIIVLLKLALPATLVMNIADFCRRYIRNEPAGSGVRDAIAGRVRDRVRYLRDCGYQQITVVGYSFGAAAAVNGLASYISDQQRQQQAARPSALAEATTTLPTGGANPAPQDEITIRLVTIAGPLDVFKRQSSEIMEKDIDVCYESDKIARWFDFWSKADWMCYMTPFPKSLPGYREQPEVDQPDMKWYQRVVFLPHRRYWDKQEVIDEIVRFDS
ncbi:unnamed protein product [Vitrella brassicaformis CCMP3155]|uniref:Fungal lipase-like domain-containing protein n=1 Tax=Vitrella brassicaformis (strain CCMP3155) TaxID=1169540 RepID=A0A0G4F600_VITBC|nr:unnamed protein product [Vitrella brassicaformis CCMP3155]|eukprot:CEM07925.1 unnamed protein product [Vitrella brassicaformis CCMP3155]